MNLLFGILLTVGTLLFILAPLFGRFGAPLTDGPDLLAQLRELYALKDVTYETIRDLQFDFHAGKIGDRDYSELSERYKREALQIVKRIDELEARIPQLRRGPAGRS